jgi:transcriptional regulator with XRE-family HTH domain
MAEVETHKKGENPNAGRRRRTIREHGPDPVDVHVGRRLRQARFLAGMSQEELGAGIGVSFQAVQKYEHGENRLSASRLYKAARLLDRPVSFFFEELSGGAPAAESNGFSREEIDLVRHFRQIPSDEVREHLLQMTKRIGSLDGSRADSKGASTASRQSA